MTHIRKATILLNGIVIGDGDATFDESDDEPYADPLHTSGRLDMIITDPAILAELRATMLPMLICTECGEGVEVDEETAAEHDGADLVCEACHDSMTKPQACATCGKRLECGPAEYTFCGECWDRRGEA